jgi:hypothetical protein
MLQAANGGTPCPDQADLEQQLECNEHDCPGEPIGETGVATLNNGITTVTMNVAFQMPAVILGPVSVPSAELIMAGSGEPDAELLQIKTNIKAHAKSQGFENPVFASIKSFGKQMVQEAGG